jgi:DNA polymerase III alpha subunit (gram-positive type)
LKIRLQNVAIEDTVSTVANAEGFAEAKNSKAIAIYTRSDVAIFPRASDAFSKLALLRLYCLNLSGCFLDQKIRIFNHSGSE